MTHVVTQSCFGCKYTDCVEACPVDCFHEGDKMLYIDPMDCIDCTDCVPACPVDAIYAEDDVPEEQSGFIELNAQMTPESPSIVKKQDPICGPDGTPNLD